MKENGIFLPSWFVWLLFSVGVLLSVELVTVVYRLHTFPKIHVVPHYVIVPCEQEHATPPVTYL